MILPFTVPVSSDEIADVLFCHEDVEHGQRRPELVLVDCSLPQSIEVEEELLHSDPALVDLGLKSGHKVLLGGRRRGELQGVGT